MLSVLYVPFYNKKLQRRTILNIFLFICEKKKEKKSIIEKNPFIILDNSCTRLCIK